MLDLKALFFKLWSPRLERRAQPVPDGKMRLQVFFGTFDDLDAAEAYCFDAPEPNIPQQLTRDLPNAYIDTDFVAVGHGPTKSAMIARFFDKSQQAELKPKHIDHNTVVLISDQAFGGFPYALNDTPVLEHCGAFVVDARPLE